MKLIEKIEGEQVKQQVPFRVGDSVKVHTRVKEGEKERTQIFAGVVIGHKGRGLNESFTVRRISYGEGVERVFPVNSPRLEKIEVEREGQVRRAKLFYLRGRKGKEALFVKERVSATVAKKAKSTANKKAKAEKDAAAKAASKSKSS
jgi:large subunit ribosomal protein L19